MNRRLHALVQRPAGAFLLLLVALVSPAQVDDVLQPIPPLQARVTDQTATLDVAQRQTLEAKLAALEAAKGAQVGVLVVATTAPEDIAAYAIRVFDVWKLGREKIDDGVLLIVAKDDRRVRIEVARGLEAAIPDAAAARIIREYIAPRFRAGDYAGGIDDAVGALVKLISDEPLPPPLDNEHAAPTGNDALADGIGAGLVALMMLRALFGGLPWWLRGFAVGIGTGFVAWLFSGSGSWPLALVFAFAGLVAALVSRGSGRFASGYGSGGFGGGGFSGGGSGGGFSGGGGRSAGGGASGSW